MQRFATLASLVPLVAAHGSIISPAPRLAGEAFGTACGSQPLSQQSADKHGNVQGILQVVGADLDPAACNLWLCKGYQFADNNDNIHTFSEGQTIPFEIEIAAPHTGIANVSVVKTTTNQIIGEPLIEFDNYASNNGLDANNTAFDVVLPTGLREECAAAGDCVLQWFWDAEGIDQTYEGCVDFSIGGGLPSDLPDMVVSTSAAAAATDAEAEAEATAIPTFAVTPTDDASSVAATSTAAPAQTDADDEGVDDDCPAEDDEEEEDDGELPVGGEDDDCPAEEDDDEEDVEEEGETPIGGEDDGDDCPAEDDEDVEEEEENDDDSGESPVGGEDDDCPVEEEEDDEEEDDDEASGESPVGGDDDCPADEDEDDVDEEEDDDASGEIPVFNPSASATVSDAAPAASDVAIGAEAVSSTGTRTRGPRAPRPTKAAVTEYVTVTADPVTVTAEVTVCPAAN